MAANELIIALDNVVSSLAGLQQDLNSADPQDETQIHLSHFVTDFDLALSLANELQSSGLQQLITEFAPIIKGDHDLFGKLKRAKEMIGQVHQQVDQDTAVKEKLEAALPEQRQGQDIGGILTEYEQHLAALGQYEAQINLFKNFL